MNNATIRRDRIAVITRANESSGARSAVDIPISGYGPAPDTLALVEAAGITGIAASGDIVHSGAMGASLWVNGRLVRAA